LAFSLRDLIVSFLKIKAMKKIILSIQFFYAWLAVLPAQDTFKQASNINIPETEKLVRAGPDDIFVQIKGSGSSVVFVSGLGEDHKNWEQVQNAVSIFAETISYDRAGLGKSSYKLKRKNLETLAWELKKTLQSAKISKPYLLVSHSLGCQISKQFAVMFPADVRGIIFIDPGFNEELLELTLGDSLWQQREAEIQKRRPKLNMATDAEIKELNKNCSIADDITKLPDVPVLLLTATKIDPDFPGSKQELLVKKQTHERWLQSIPASKQILVPQSRHYIHNDAPELVINEIKKMLDTKLK
jgi:pimeloyl-ACP methyl ester carboxylesterase